MRESSFLHFGAYWILFALTVTLQVFVDVSGRDFHLIVVLALATLLYPFVKKRIDKWDVLLIVIYLLVGLFSLLFYSDTFKASSYAFTGVFFFSFLTYKALCQQNIISLEGFCRFIRWMLIAYLILLIIQQVQWTIGMIPINDRYFEGFKRPSLAMEPSNTVLIVPTLLLAFIKLQEIIRGEKKYKLRHIWKEDKLYWFAGIYVSTTCGAMTMVISLPVLFCYFFNRKIILYIPVILLIIFCFGLALKKYNKDLFDRIENLSQITQLDSSLIVSVDASASARFVPYIEYFSSVDLADSKTWTGHGVGALEKKCNYIIVMDEEKNIGAANLFSLFYDNGMIIGFLFVLFLVSMISSRLLSYEVFFYFAVISVVPVNRSIIWMFVFYMFTIKWLRKHEKNKFDVVKVVRQKNRVR